MSFNLTSRQRQKAATRERLLRAAEACFAEHGFDATTVSAIARRARVAHGTFYVHFESKEAVLDELLVEFNTRFAERLGAIVTQSAQSVRDRVRAAAVVFLTYWDEHRDFVRAYAERAAAGLALDDLRDGINPPMVRLLSAALDRYFAERAPEIQRAPPIPSALITHALLAMWMRVGLQFLFNGAVTKAIAADTLTAMTIGAIETAVKGVP